MRRYHAILLGHMGSSLEQKRIGKLLSFFGVSWRDLTVTDFLTEVTGRQLTSARVFCSAEVFLRLIKDFEGSFDDRDLWKEHVHSVFVHSSDNLAALQELTRLLTRDQRAAVSKIDAGTVNLAVSNHFDDFCGVMAGMRVAGSAPCVNSALIFDSSYENAINIISASSGAALLKVRYQNVPVFLSSYNKIVDVDAELTTQNFDVREHFLSAVPSVLYIKWAFAKTCWSASEINACLIIDDPLLKPTHGFVKFDCLLSLMKRHGFSGQGASHGAQAVHRRPGSIGGCATPGRVFKGTRMSGRMGNDRVTTQNLLVHKVDAENGVLLIKGAIPGRTGGLVVVRSAIKRGEK